MKSETYYVASRKERKVEKLTGFNCWEAVQSAFAFGFVMSDGTKADAIGRKPWRKVCEFATVHGWKVLSS
jgi:hypothetical protein